jgi:adenine-specific DNA-methyltransferase
MSTVKRKSHPVARTSAALAGDQLVRLKEIFPACFTEGRVDFDKLRETLGEAVDSRPERYSFTWAGKRDAIRLLQTPSRATLIPCPKESVNFEETGNLFIEGDNLEVLKLLYKSYFGRVKMIYIDPPYNTGNDFIYPDNFADPLDTYLRLTGQKEANGNLLTSNPETSGRYHSAWLSMMYPRLFLARQFLQEDGAIFVSIADHEVHNLRMLMNEVFGEENFIATIIWHKMDSPKNSAVHLSEDHDYILIYARNAELWRPNSLQRSEEMLARYKNPDDDPRGSWLLSDLAARNYYGEGRYPITTPSGKVISGPPAGSFWRISKKKFDELNRDNRIWWGKSGDNRPGIKRFLSEVREGVVPQTYWSWKEVGSTRNAKQELSQIMQAGSGEELFITPKPARLIKRMLEIASDEDSVILDFFAGSGSTGQAVLDLNSEDGGRRKFIIVQIPEPTGHADYATISELAKERIRRAIKKLNDGDMGKLTPKDADRQDRGFKVFKLAESNYKTWTGVDQKDSEAYGGTMKLYTDPLVPGWKPENVIWEVIIKEGFGLNSSIEKLSEIKGNTVYQVSDPERVQTFRICLDDALKPATIKALNLGKDDLFICRDKALDDEGAANLALQCRLKTI